MADYLIALSVGPVQGFIAAARRTRDLWFGSYVLSEVSKAAAQVWNNQSGAQLVFPAPSNADDLNPDSVLNVGNRILAIVSTDDPRAMLELAKEGARTQWNELARRARGEIAAESIDNATWEFQVNDVLEFQGAWVKLEDRQSGYGRAYKHLDRLLAARKNTRTFEPGAPAFDATPGFGKRKSSLDGARESVFTGTLTAHVRRKLGLTKGEQLDCPGVVKRLAEDPEQFPPVTRVALEAWLEQVPDEDLIEANKALEKLCAMRLVSRVRPLRYSRLPYDGAFLFPSRIDAEEGQLEPSEAEVAKPLFRTCEGVRNALWKKYGVPSPYFGVLVADGDQMGSWISGLDSDIKHKELSSALASFAGKAREIVERHQGACVYAGGDDVLALLPIHKAVACAEDLRQGFSTILSKSIDSSKVPTLSVGIGVGHVMTPFGRLLDLGRRAEKLAKEGADGKGLRDALAVVVGVRSGSEFSVHGKWNQGITERLRQWTGYFQADHLSDKTAFGLREAIRTLAWARTRPDFVDVAASEVTRVLAKKRAEAGTRELTLDVKNKVMDAIKDHGVDTIVGELLVARWLSQRVKE
ncbi:MAG: type III-B CRISPR-associated protein Cas10/Cmr2 [Nitrospirae bacterium]|nr:type III-B CRISPR-associated protein Cas10/Cmr2 [Nitrospirota bacterium]